MWEELHSTVLVNNVVIFGLYLTVKETIIAFLNSKIVFTNNLIPILVSGYMIVLSAVVSFQWIQKTHRIMCNEEPIDIES